MESSHVHCDNYKLFDITHISILMVITSANIKTPPYWRTHYMSTNVKYSIHMHE